MTPIWFSETWVDCFLVTDDRDWNIIALSPKLWKYWDREYFGLECVDSQQQGDMTRLTLRLNWLPILKEKQDPTRKINLDHPDEIPAPVFFDPRHEYTYGDLYGDLYEHRPCGTLSTGDTFSLDVKAENADKTMRALKLRWTMMQIASMSGAVASPEVLRAHLNFHDHNLDPDEVGANEVPRLPSQILKARLESFQREKQGKGRRVEGQGARESW
ncbi:hypothetical protein QBC35DRAFT_495355 [Podospora australis]|uniref:HNH nuclease domain-containing protein n=1 Tax=Podospora australis TaxID=1536484 RepID=A0AAN7AIW0_9PEZI|nr:hypothetical protein QBC35DRAFT_495355 [Podospora australis]